MNERSLKIRTEEVLNERSLKIRTEEVLNERSLKCRRNDEHSLMNVSAASSGMLQSDL